MRSETLIESRSYILELTESEAEALRTLGRKLASDRAWWGTEDTPADRSIIECVRHSANRWSVRVGDAVGVIAVADLQLEIRPKIPISHLLFLLIQSGWLPRIADEPVEIQTNDSLWELVARWYIHEATRVLRFDLLRDYESETDWLDVVRGRVHIHGTTTAYYRGRIDLLCEFEEFNQDTPLNRVLLDASRHVASSSILPWSIRRSALSIAARMEGVGSLRAGDLAVSVDRRTKQYASAVSLARHVILRYGRTLIAGEHLGESFLIRTPEIVESGLRTVLKESLGAKWTIAKRGRQLPNSTMTFNPDLVVNDGLAVADVKYKIASDDWDRGDLYQIVSFATAYRAKQAALLSFARSRFPTTTQLRVGDMQVRRLFWPASDDVSPSVASSAMCDQFVTWLEQARATH